MQGRFSAARVFLIVSVVLVATAVGQNNSLRQNVDLRSSALNIEKANKRPASVIERSIKDYEKLLRSTPSDAILLNNLGVLYYLSNRTFEAQSVLRKAAQAQPDSSPIQVNLAIALNKTYNPELAITILEKVLAKTPDQERAREVLCEFYSEQKRIPDAMKCYDMLERSGKIGAVAVSNYAAALLENDHLDHAFRLLTWADSKFPDNPAIKNGLGIAQFRKKKYSQAETSLLRAVELAPDTSQVRYNLAVTQMATNKRGDVLEQYKYLKTADPELASRLFKMLFRDKVVSVSGN